MYKSDPAATIASRPASALGGGRGSMRGPGNSEHACSDNAMLLIHHTGGNVRMLGAPTHATLSRNTSRKEGLEENAATLRGPGKNTHRVLPLKRTQAALHNTGHGWHQTRSPRHGKEYGPKKQDSDTRVLTPINVAALSPEQGTHIRGKGFYHVGRAPILRAMGNWGQARNCNDHRGKET